jgi:hypothetical protein
LVNEATGVKFLKDGMEPSGEPKKRSSQGDKIAAAAAAVGPGRGRGRKGDKPTPTGKPSDKRPQGNVAPKKDSKPGAPRNGGNAPRDGRSGGRRGEPRRDNKPRDPAMKDRLDYYKSKYGEDFKPAHVEEKAKPGLLGRIAGLFGLGKKKEK